MLLQRLAGVETLRANFFRGGVRWVVGRNRRSGQRESDLHFQFGKHRAPRARLFCGVAEPILKRRQRKGCSRSQLESAVVTGVKIRFEGEIASRKS